jgi:hypothetical protein
MCFENFTTRGLNSFCVLRFASETYKSRDFCHSSSLQNGDESIIVWNDVVESINNNTPFGNFESRKISLELNY